MKHEVQKLYHVETTLADALKMLSKMAQNPELKQALDMHRVETVGHIGRLQKICGKMGWDPIGVPSPTIKAMAMETLTSLNGAEPGPVTDALIIASAQKSEHLEIASYGTARTLARQMGDEEVADLLGQTLEEEKKADAKLTAIAESGINQQAAATA
ncbi:ferritin-like domain-containing protein [soil metagenome]